MKFRITADMAIVRYAANIRLASGRQVSLWHTDAYENRADGWQAVWSQATEIKLPAPAKEPAK